MCGRTDPAAKAAPAGMTSVPLGRSGQLWEGLFCVGGCSGWRHLPTGPPGLLPGRLLAGPRALGGVGGAEAMSPPHPEWSRFGVCSWAQLQPGSKGAFLCSCCGPCWCWADPLPPPRPRSPDEGGVITLPVKVGSQVLVPHLKPSLPLGSSRRVHSLGGSLEADGPTQRQPAPPECPGNISPCPRPQMCLGIAPSFCGGPSAY